MKKFLSTTVASLLLLAALPGRAQVAFPQQGGELVPQPQVVGLQKEKTNKVMLRKVTKALPVAKAPAATSYAGRQFYGNLVNSNDWSGASLGSVPYGIYDYTFGADTDWHAIATDGTYNFYASAYGRDRLIGVYPMSMMGILNGVRYICLGGDKFDEQWEEVYAEVSYGYIPAVIAYDPTSDKFYAGLYNDALNGMNWTVFNEQTRKFDVLHKWTNTFQPLTLAATPDGRLFSIGADGGYYELDKATGEASLIAELDVTPANYVQAMGYDARTATFLWQAVLTTGTGLYSLDPETGEATLINSLTKNEQLSSLFFKTNEAQDAAPAAIEDLAFSFTGTAGQSGNLTFTVPSTSYAGTALTGSLRMTVYVDGQALVSSKSVQPGSAQSVAVSLTNDNHYVNVTLQNAAGFSPNNFLYQYVGYDTPVAPTDVVFSTSDDENTFNVTWKAPTASVNNGYVDYDNLKYNVVRMPDSTTVATGLTATSFSEPAPEALARYSYRVYAVNSDKTGAYAESNDILLGKAYTVPYNEDFATSETQSLFTIIDGSGEGVTWEYNSYSQCMGINNSAYTITDRNNDWLITPAITLEPGTTYGVVYNMRNTFQNYWESCKIMLGTNPTDTTTFHEINRYDSLETKGVLTDFETDFQVSASGRYYLAIVCYSAREHASSLFVDNISVEAIGKNGSPAAPTALSLTPEAEGEMQATLAFTLPTETLTGDALSGQLSARIYRDNATEPIASLSNLTAGQQTQYTDNAVTGVGNHTYTVAAVNSEGEGKKLSATAFIGVYTPTYTNEFNSEADAQFFTTYIDGVEQDASSYYKWSYNQYSSYLGLSYWPSNPPTNIDLAFPAIKLGADSVYAVSFVWNNNYYGDYEVPVEMGYSRSADLAEKTAIGTLPKTSYGANLLEEFELVSDTKGKYFPYLRVTANDQVYLMPSIDSLVIKKVGSARAPYSVTDLNVTAGAQGALQATVACKAPTKDYAGRALTGTMDVKVFRGTNMTIPAYTFTAVEPGADLSWTDTQAQQGNDAYMLLPVNSYGNGKAATDTCYVGIDFPLPVKNFTAVGDAKNTGVKLTWDASEGGVNGGYLDSSLAYNVVEYFPDETETSKMMKVLGQTKKLSYAIENVEVADSQAVHYYFIFPQTSAGVGSYTYAYSVLGKLYELPFKESFANGAETTNVWLAGSTNQYAAWQETQDGTTCASQDSDNGLAVYFFGSYYTQEVEGTLITPKFAVAEGAQVKFWLYQGFPKSYTRSAYLLVKQNVNDGAYEAISDTLKIEDAASEGWVAYTLPLKNLTGANYATLEFEAGVSGMSDYVFIDNIEVFGSATGINDVRAQGQTVRGTRNGISFQGEAGLDATVYTTGGVLVDRFTTTGNDIRTLQPGVYLVRTEGQQAEKVIVK